MNTVKKRLRRVPWSFYLPMLALLLWAMVGGIYLGMWAAGRQSAEPVEVERVQPVKTEPVRIATVLAAAPAVEDKPELLALGDFKITHYCPGACCCGEWADGYTSTGTKATEGRTIAVDPDVIPYGAEILVRYQDGTEAAYIAEDCGGAIQGNRIDIFMDSHEAALVEGVKTAKVYMVEG